MDEPNLLNYARVVASRYRIVVGCTLVAAVVGLALSFVLPRVYRAEATIYVVPNPAGGLSGMLRGLALGPDVSDTLASRNQSDVANYLIAVLESRSLAAEVAKILRLARHPLFASTSDDKTRLARQARSYMDIRGEFTGRITVSADTPSPSLSASLANAYVRALDEFVYTQSKTRRQFIERRLGESRRELRQAEEALRRFQQEYKTFALDREAEQQIETWSQFSAEAIGNDLALQENARALEVTGSVPALVRLRAERAALLARQAGLRQALLTMKRDMARLPDTALALARLKRDAETKEAIVRLLAEQYESARIAESETEVKFQVLDTAQPPRAPIRPSKPLNLSLGALVGLIIGIVAALATESRRAASREKPA